MYLFTTYKTKIIFITIRDTAVDVDEINGGVYISVILNTIH